MQLNTSSQFLLVELESILGKSSKTSRSNYSFICPFCNHSGKKLEVDLATNDKGENKYACWVCGVKGRTLKSLLYKLNVSKEKRYSTLKYISSTSSTYEPIIKQQLQLPKEFKSLSETSSTSVVARNALSYIYNRGLTDLDILRYNIGYCSSGEYEGRIIVPSYDSKNNLNFFIGRSFNNAAFKYKNPAIVKDNLIVFENLINWELPIVLVEGVFDAIAVKRNAIPMLGKNLPIPIVKELLLNGTKEVYVALDKDAKKEAINISLKLFNSGISTYLVELPKKDPGEMKLSEIFYTLRSTEEVNEGTIIKHKLNL